MEISKKFLIFFSIILFFPLNFVLAGIVCKGWEEHIKKAIEKSGLSQCSHLDPEKIMHAMFYKESSCGKFRTVTPTIQKCIEYEFYLRKKGKVKGSDEQLINRCKRWDAVYTNEVCAYLARCGKSCGKTSPDYGMGYAQFQPTTWWPGYVKRLEALGIQCPDPWDIEHAALAMAVKLKTDGFCQDPFRAVWKYNGRKEYAQDVFRRAFGGIERAIEAASQAIKETLTNLINKRKDLELKYPEILGLRPTTTEIGLQFFQYLYTFFIWALGFIFLGSMVYGGIKWMTAQTPEEVKIAQSRIIGSFVGVIIVLGSWIILRTIEPEFVAFFVEKHPSSEAPIPPVPIPEEEKPKEIVAVEIPLGKTIDGFRKEVEQPKQTLLPFKTFLEGGNSNLTEILAKPHIPNFDGEYGILDIKKEELEEWKNLNERIKNINFKDRNILDNYNTPSPLVKSQLEQLKDILEREVQALDPQCTSQSFIRPPGCVCLSEYKEMLNLTKEIENTLDSFMQNGNRNNAQVVQKLKDSREDVNKVLSSYIEVPNLSLFLYEDYSSNGEQQVKEIVEKVKGFNSFIQTCRTLIDSLSSLGGMSLFDSLIDTVNKFSEGYKIRKLIWESIEKSTNFSVKTLQTFKKQADKSWSANPLGFLYEGSFAKTRLERILNLQNLIESQMEKIQTTALSIEAAAASLYILTYICHCDFCWVGDPCAPVRPAIVAAQITLGATAATLPPLASNLQKQIEKEREEIQKLKESLEKLTEGVKKAEELILKCQGSKGGFVYQLFPLAQFLDYQEKAKKYGYEIKIIKSRPEIQIQNDPFTFYCVLGPILEEISNVAIYSPSLAKERLVCRPRENQVIELVEKTEKVIKESGKMLDQMNNIASNAQKIVNEIKRRGTDSNDQGISSDVKGQIGKEVFQNISATTFTEFFKHTATKYSKDLVNHLIENLPGEKVKDNFLKAFESLSEENLRKFLENYLNSMKNDAKKRIAQAIFEGIKDEKLKEILMGGFENYNEKDLKSFWKDLLRNLENEGRELLFKRYLNIVELDDAKKFYDEIFNGLSLSQRKEFLKSVLKGEQRATLEKLLPQDLREDLNYYKNWESLVNDLIESEVDEIYKKLGEYLYEKGKIKEALNKVPTYLLEGAIKNLPEEKVKIFTKIFIEGIDKTTIKDFLIQNIVEMDPNFLGRFIKYSPDTTLKEIFVDQIFRSLSDSDFKEILLLMNQMVDADPKNVLNNLLLKYIPTLDDLFKAADTLSNFVKSDFFQETLAVAKVAGVETQLEVLKDRIDKVTNYILEIKQTVNQILAQISLPLEELQNFAKDIWNQIPEITLIKIWDETIVNQVLPQVLVNDLEDFIDEILTKIALLPSEDLQEVIDELVTILPNNELIKFYEEIIATSTKAELEEIFEEVASFLSIEALDEGFKEYYSSVPEEVLQECGKQSLENSKYFFYCIFKHLEDNHIRNILIKEIKNNIPSEELPHVLPSSLATSENLEKLTKKIGAQKTIEILPQILSDEMFKEIGKEILSKVPQVAIGNVIDSLLDSLPKGNGEIFTEFLNDLPLGEFERLKNEIFEALPLHKIEEFRDKIISYATDEINRTIDKVASELGRKVDEILRDVGLSPDSALFKAAFSGGPGVKQNLLEMLKFSKKFTCGLCRFSCSFFGGCDWSGPHPLPPWYEIKRTFNLISANVTRILTFKGVAEIAIDENSEIIEEDVKNDILKNLNENRTEFSLCGPGNYVVKCKDALLYGWTKECKRNWNFLCCFKPRK